VPVYDNVIKVLNTITADYRSSDPEVLEAGQTSMVVVMHWLVNADAESRQTTLLAPEVDRTAVALLASAAIGELFLMGWDMDTNEFPDEKLPPSGG